MPGERPAVGRRFGVLAAVVALALLAAVGASLVEPLGALRERDLELEPAWLVAGSLVLALHGLGVAGVYGRCLSHLGAELHQTPHGAAPDEAESPGHERAPSCQAGAELAAHFWIRRSTISSHQSRPRPRATCPTRLKLKNCERPCSRW